MGGGVGGGEQRGKNWGHCNRIFSKKIKISRKKREKVIPQVHWGTVSSQIPLKKHMKTIFVSPGQEDCQVKATRRHRE